MLKLTTNKILYGGAAVIFAAWSGYGFGLLKSTDDWGTFGDSFGVLNTLFTGLASIGVVAALWHERENREDRKAEKEAEDAQSREQQAERDRQHKELVAVMSEQAEASTITSKVQTIICQLQQLDAELDRMNDTIIQDKKNEKGFRRMAVAMMEERADEIHRQKRILNDRLSDLTGEQKMP